MRSLRSLIAFVSSFVAVAVSAHAAPGYYPAVVVADSAKDLAYLTSELTVNDFPLAVMKPALVCDKHGPNYCLGALRDYRRVHPYFLVNGKNAVRVSYGVGKGQGDGPFTFAFDVQLAISNPDSDKWILGKVLATIATPPFSPNADSDKRATMTSAFEFDGKLPVWHWTKGATIHDTPEARKSLFAAYQKVWNALDTLGKQSSSAQKKFEADLRRDTAEFIVAGQLARPDLDPITNLMNHALHRKEKVPLGLRTLPEFENMHMDILAGGRLARLKYYYAELIRFQGGAHDAPRGQAGPVEYAYDLWFRLDDKGQWQLDAVVPTGEE